MNSTLDTLRRLLLGLGLIAAAAAVLLFSDLRSRRTAADATNPAAAAANSAGPRRIAILQHSSSQVMDDIREGMLEGLSAHGWTAGPRLSIDVYNAQADLPTGNAIASKLASGGYDVVATISTPMLQAFANANRDGRAKHVFCGVTAPIEAGVGVKSLDSTDKPAWMTGIGTAQPVDAIFREAKRLQPALQTVGVAWNPAEVNSEVCTKRARAVSEALGMKLIEAPIESAKDVPEAAGSLVARGAQAFWTGGDATIVPALDALVGIANKAGIPVFSNMAGQVEHGTTFDLGANYREVGGESGRIVAAILDGANPATIPVRNFMPARLLLNERAASGLRDPIAFDEATRARADGIVGMDGVLLARARPEPSPAPVAGAVSPGVSPGDAGALGALPDPNAAAALGGPLGGKPRVIAAVMYIETPPMEQGLEGVREGLAAAGLVHGRDWEMRVHSAQGDVAILSGIVDGILASAPDVVLALSTPALQAVANKVKKLPVVFSIVSNPFIAGAGTSDGDHLPNVAGVYMSGPFARTAKLLHEHFPHWKNVGTLFCPAEVNSVFNEGQLREALAAEGIKLDSIPASTAADLPDAAAALASRPIDAIVQISDNQSSSGFPAIARAAVRSHKPLFAFNRQALEQGAAVAVAQEYLDAGKASGSILARILRGTAPGALPFLDFREDVLLVDPDHARILHFVLPPSLLAAAAAEATSATPTPVAMPTAGSPAQTGAGVAAGATAAGGR